MIKRHLFKKNDTKLNCLRIIFGFGITNGDCNCLWKMVMCKVTILSLNTEEICISKHKPQSLSCLMDLITLLASIINFSYLIPL